jgi:hypothetical protein
MPRIWGRPSRFQANVPGQGTRFWIGLTSWMQADPASRSASVGDEGSRSHMPQQSLGRGQDVHAASYRNTRSGLQTLGTAAELLKLQDCC